MAHKDEWIGPESLNKTLRFACIEKFSTKDAVDEVGFGFCSSHLNIREFKLNSKQISKIIEIAERMSRFVSVRVFCSFPVEIQETSSLLLARERE